MEHYDSAILYRPFYISAMLLVIQFFFVISTNVPFSCFLKSFFQILDLFESKDPLQNGFVKMNLAEVIIHIASICKATFDGQYFLMFEKIF